MQWENAYKSLLGCMVGTISNIELLLTRTSLQDNWDEKVQSYYMISVNAHCEMSIFEDKQVQ